MTEHDCKFTRDDQDKITKLTFMADEIKRKIEEVVKYFDKNVSNDTVKTTIDDLAKKFETFTATALSTKMSALSISLEDLDESVAAISDQLNQVISHFNNKHVLHDDMADMKADLDAIRYKIAPKKNGDKKSSAKLIDWFTRLKFWQIVLLLMMILSLFGAFNFQEFMQNIVSRTMDKKFKKYMNESGVMNESIGSGRHKGIPNSSPDRIEK